MDLNSTKVLTKENLRSIAPSIFSETPSNEVSAKYTHIPTERVIDDMAKLGWDVVEAKEVKARTNGTKGFQKHLLIFRNKDLKIIGADGDDVIPQILVTNSHDAKNAFTFTAGLFRFICENGIVISSQEFEKLKIRHMGYTFTALQVKIKEMVLRLPLTVESMNKMISTKLRKKDIISFAKASLGVRFGDDLKNIKIDINDFITPTRDEDVGNNLWVVFNTIQEKLISGDFNYTSGGKLRKAREIKNFNQDIKVNTELFDLALEYVK